MTDRGLPTIGGYDMIILSDSDDETDYMRDKHMVIIDPQEEEVQAAPVIEEEPMEEDPEEDPEDDPAHDLDEQVPIEVLPEPDYDPAWDGPAAGEDFAVGDMPDPEIDLDAEMVVQLIEHAIADVQAAEERRQEQAATYETRLEEADTLRQQQAADYERRIARLTYLLDSERRRCDSSVMALHSAQRLRAVVQGRLDRLTAEVRDSFRGLLSRVRSFPHFAPYQSFSISRGVVEDMILDTEQTMVGRE